MLDHRNITVSSHQYGGEPGRLDPRDERVRLAMRCWAASLTTAGARRTSHPPLAEDLSGLPTTYIDAGTAEVFRDEDVDYASRIWAAGGQAELHVWAGGFHGFDSLFPAAVVSAAARRTRPSGSPASSTTDPLP